MRNLSRIWAFWSGFRRCSDMVLVGVPVFEHWRRRRGRRRLEWDGRVKSLSEEELARDSLARFLKVLGVQLDVLASWGERS